MEGNSVLPTPPHSVQGSGYGSGAGDDTEFLEDVFQMF
ncbi:MAG: hypothetical protein RLZZ226_2061, partial [Pseudomonadota bacterium]